MSSKDKFADLDKAVKGAALKEKSDTTPINTEKKRKMISIRVDWENRIKEYYGGTVAGYITSAIQEKMERDGLLKS